jgi:hypothetical protein
MGMHNFLAEVSNFFFDGTADGGYTKFESKPVKEWRQDWISGRRYRLPISIYQGPKTAISEGAFNGEALAGLSATPPATGAPNFMKKEAMDLRGIPYAPALLRNNKAAALEQYNTVGPSCAPWTPPGFYGDPAAPLPGETLIATYTATKSGAHTYDDVFSNLKFHNVIADASGTLAANSFIDQGDAWRNRTTVTSSINIRGQRTVPDLINTTSNMTHYSPPTSDRGDNKIAIIHTKQDFPVFNNYDASVGRTVPVSMWNNYGSMPTSGEGLFLAINPATASAEGSLAEMIGMPIGSKPVGIISENKVIEQAVVAVPFVKRNGKKKVFPIENWDKAIEEDGNNTITRLDKALRKFVFPPNMDFIRNRKNVNPFIMYVLPFKHVLDQEDLRLIWHNLMPKIARTAEKETISIEHSLNDPDNEFYYPNGSIPNDTRWMIFKVNQRAANNYYGQQARALGKGEEEMGEKEREYPFSYNWPYDYFSLVEMVKVDADITLSCFKEDDPLSDEDCVETKKK